MIVRVPKNADNLCSYHEKLLPATQLAAIQLKAIQKEIRSVRSGRKIHLDLLETKISDLQAILPCVSMHNITELMLHVSSFKPDNVSGEMLVKLIRLPHLDTLYLSHLDLGQVGNFLNRFEQFHKHVVEKLEEEFMASPQTRGAGASDLDFWRSCSHAMSSQAIDILLTIPAEAMKLMSKVIFIPKVWMNDPDVAKRVPREIWRYHKVFYDRV